MPEVTLFSELRLGQKFTMNGLNADRRLQKISRSFAYDIDTKRGLHVDCEEHVRVES